MTEEASGGLPWTHAVAALGVMGTVVGVLWKAHAAALRERIEDLTRARDAAHDAKEALRVELSAKVEAAERRADAKEDELKAHLQESIKVLSHLRASRGPEGRRYPPRPPGDTLDAMKTDFRNLSEVLTPEDLRAVKDRMEGR